MLSKNSSYLKIHIKNSCYIKIHVGLKSTQFFEVNSLKISRVKKRVRKRKGGESGVGGKRREKKDNKDIDVNFHWRYPFVEPVYVSSI